MNNTSTQRSATRITLEVTRAGDGRLEGRARLDALNTWRSFSGVLELLKVIEEYASNADSENSTSTPTQKEFE